MKNNKLIAIAVAVLLSGLAFRVGGIMAVIGIVLSVYAFYRLLSQDDKWFPIGELALSMGAFQWIISPLIAYTMPSPMFPMSQSCSEYMLYTVPLYSCLMIGYLKFRKPAYIANEEMQVKCSHAIKVAKVFIVLGLFMTILPLNIPLINQINKFISLLMYAGFIIMMIADPQKSLLYMCIPLVITLLFSIRSGMFHELMTWGCFLLFVWFRVNKVSVGRRLLIIVVALLMVNTLQTVKSSFRETAWHSSEYNVTLFIDLMINSASGSASLESEADNNSRYNQGWIISSIYNHVPGNHDYFYGRTYADALVSTLLPRFLAPNKKGSGQQVQSDFMEMTGIVINKNTSMGLSTIGEAYGNFGIIGGCLFLLLWGWFIAKIETLHHNMSQKRNFIWLIIMPITCFVLIEAELSMMTVLNWTVKGIIFAMIVAYFTRNYANNRFVQ